MVSYELGKRLRKRFFRAHRKVSLAYEFYPPLVRILVSVHI